MSIEIVPITEPAPCQLLTHSRKQCAQTCLRKHYLRYELGLRPVKSATALRMGSAFHLGLEMLDGGEPMDLVAEWIRANYSELPNWVALGGPDEIADWMTECETVVQLVRGHAERWAGDGFEVVATEQKFELPLLNPETGRPSVIWKLAGKLDRIVRLADGRLAVQEYKTTGDSLDPDGDYWKRLRIDSQISLYVVAARQLAEKYQNPLFNVETVIYDVTKKPGIRPRKLTVKERAALDWGPDAPERETPEMYGERLAADLRERPDFYFARQEIPRLESDLEECQHEIWQMQQLIRECQRTGRWPRNAGACLMFGKCEYFEICIGARDVREETPPGFERVAELHPELK